MEERPHSIYDRVLGVIEKHLPLLSVVAFVGGVILTHVSTAAAMQVNEGVNSFVDAYGMIAPLVIYLILTPSLTMVLSSAHGDGRDFVDKIFVWFAGVRVIALLWAVLFTSVVFGLPLFSQESSSFSDAFFGSMEKLGWMLTHSSYFYAIYLSIFTVWVALRIPAMARSLSRGFMMIEELGKHIIPVIPVFMLAIGTYVAYLPTAIQGQLDDSYAEQAGEAAGGFQLTGLHEIDVMGFFSINPDNSMGMIGAYILGAGLTGVGVMIWHLALLLLARYRVSSFSISYYFRSYWSKVYPLLWSTSSEALATPLNLHLVKKHYPQINNEIRGLTIGGGSFLGINGTLICVYVLGGLVTSMLGIEVTVMQLLLSIPIIFLLGFGVPGIPGELIVFAGPISVILGVPVEVIPVFLALYVGLQIGLPDSFRTATNSTDDCVNSIILQNLYDKQQTAATEQPAVVQSQ